MEIVVRLTRPYTYELPQFSVKYHRHLAAIFKAEFCDPPEFSESVERSYYKDIDNATAKQNSNLISIRASELLPGSHEPIVLITHEGVRSNILA